MDPVPRKRGEDLWGDRPALPRSLPNRDPILDKVKRRDTPAGRLLEHRMSDVESLLLAFGILAILFDITPIVALAAIAVLIARGIGTYDLVRFLKVQTFTLVAGTGLLIAVAFSLGSAGVANGRLEAFTELSEGAMFLTAAHALIVGGVLANLFALSGFHGFVRELKDRYPDIYREIEHS